MAIMPDTVVGTVTLAAGETAFTTTGVNMQTRGHLPGDSIMRNGLVLVIGEITGQNAGFLRDPCPAGANGTGPARIRFQPDGSRVAAQARNLMSLLEGNAFFQFDASGPIEDRMLHDNRPQGFSFLDTSTVPFGLYIKASGDPGDWSGPSSYVQGERGLPSDVEIGEVATLPSGEPAYATLTGTAPNYTLDLGIPGGTVVTIGPVTTLAPGSAASVDPVPTADGVRLDFHIPRGDTGDIDGVTPFWVTRLSEDADGDAARAGLGLTIGEDVQAYHDRLAALAGLAGGADLLPYLAGDTAMAQTPLTEFARSLLDDVDGPAMLATLGAAALAGAAFTGHVESRPQSGSGRFIAYADDDPARQFYLARTPAAAWLWEMANTYIGIGTNNTERVRIHGGGQVTMAVQPTAQANGPATSFSTSASRIPFATPSINKGGHWNPSTNLWTCPVAGNYLVTFDTEYDGSAATVMSVAIRQNGVIVRRCYASSGNSAGKRYENVSLQTVAQCDAGDTLDFYLVSGFIEAGVYTGMSITLLN